MTQITSAYALGRDDYYNGRDLTDNPYNPGTVGYDEWEEGYLDTKYQMDPMTR